MSSSMDSRRHFITAFSGLGLGAAVLPEAVWARMEEEGKPQLDAAMLKDAAAVAGIQFSDAEVDGMVQGVNQNLARIEALHGIQIPNDVAPPFYFSPIVPGMKVDRAALPLRLSKPAELRRPRNLEEVAFWPVTQ